VLVDHRSVDRLAIYDGPDQAFHAGAAAAVSLALEEDGFFGDRQALALSRLD
jgi:hypothetical protein